MSLCSELENMNTTINYFDFIKEIFDDYIKYISNYKNISNEYIKKITQLQEKYGSRLTGKEIDNTKYKNIKTNHIYSITSAIPKIIGKHLENLKLIMIGIDGQIENYNLIIKEKDILSSKIQLMFEEATKDLLKKYKEIEKLRDNFMESMSNTEDIIINYLKRDNSSSLNDMKNSISNSKKLEKEYKKLIKATGCYEDTFDSLYSSSVENIKKLASETSSQMKDIIIDFIILLKNNIKLQLSEIDVYLPSLSELNEIKTLENIIEKSFKSDNKLMHVSPDKYQLKIFQKDDDDEDILSSHPILTIEDGFEEMTLLKDENILSVFKTLKENFDLIEDNNMNLKIEEEKIKCLQLTDKILELELGNTKLKKKNKNKNNNNNNNIGPTNEEIEELNKLLDIHHNRVVFLQRLSEYRNKGKFELNQKTFDLLCKLFNTIVNTVKRDKDFHSVKNVIILSQTYYIKTDKKKGKKYLQKNIQDNEIFKSKKFWEEFLEFSINREIVTCVNNDVKNGNILKENRREAEDKMSNIAFSQILPFADNMIEFGVDKNTIQEVVFPKMTLYKMSKDLIDTIKSVIDSKCI